MRRANVVYESTVEEPNYISKEYNNKGYNKLRNVGDGLQLHFLKARGNWFDNTLIDTAYEESKFLCGFFSFIIRYELFCYVSDERHLRKLVELHRIHLFNILTQHKAIFLSDMQGSKLKSNDLNGAAALSCWLKEKVRIFQLSIN